MDVREVPSLPAGGGRRHQTCLVMIPDCFGGASVGGSELGQQPSPTSWEQHMQPYQSVRVASASSLHLWHQS